MLNLLLSTFKSVIVQRVVCICLFFFNGGFVFISLTIIALASLEIKQSTCHSLPSAEEFKMCVSPFSIKTVHFKMLNTQKMLNTLYLISYINRSKSLSVIKGSVLDIENSN